MENNTFKTLSQINVNGMVEKKQTGGSTLTYLSWASAWQVAKENFPDIEYEIEKNPETGYLTGMTHSLDTWFLQRLPLAVRHMKCGCQ